MAGRHLGAFPAQGIYKGYSVDKLSRIYAGEFVKNPVPSYHVFPGFF